MVPHQTYASLAILYIHTGANNAMPLPDFSPPTIYDLRRFWVKYRRNEDVRRLILEVEHQRRVMRTVDSYRATIDKCWKAEVGGKLVALDSLKALILDESTRSGTFDEPKE